MQAPAEVRHGTWRTAPMHAPSMTPPLHSPLPWGCTTRHNASSAVRWLHRPDGCGCRCSCCTTVPLHSPLPVHATFERACAEASAGVTSMMKDVRARAVVQQLAVRLHGAWLHGSPLLPSAGGGPEVPRERQHEGRGSAVVHQLAVRLRRSPLLAPWLAAASQCKRRRAEGGERLVE